MSLEKFQIQKETLNKNINVIRNKTKEIYKQEKEITPEQILEIKEKLEKIPNLVINFDETMTAKNTVSKVLDYLIEELPKEKSDKIQENRKSFSGIIKENKLAKEKGVKPDITQVKYFYENVINGIQLDELNKVYDRIVDETELNPNLEKVFDYLKKELGIKTIPLFALSLNNHELIRKFYEKNIDFFKKHNVEIIDIIGNQIKTDGNNQITGIYEHVTDQNKSEYIPTQSIMLADDRETESLVEKGVNVVNVQGEKFREELLDISFEVSEYISLIKKYENDAGFNNLKNNVLKVVSMIKNIKLNWEQTKDENTLQKDLLAIEKLTLDLDNQYAIFTLEINN